MLKNVWLVTAKAASLLFLSVVATNTLVVRYLSISNVFRRAYFQCLTHETLCTVQLTDHTTDSWLMEGDATVYPHIILKL